MHSETVYEDPGIAYMYTVRIRIEEGGKKGRGKLEPGETLVQRLSLLRFARSLNESYKNL